MICQFCSKNTATVHLTDIINKQKRELHLCEACAREQQLLPSGPTPELNLQALVQLIMGQPLPTDPNALTCPSCGLKYAAFRAEGRLGCPDDYDAFHEALEPLLERIHRSTHHDGKHPRTAAKRAELMDLHEQLNAAVAGERYEVAAKLHAQIRQKETTDEPG